MLKSTRWLTIVCAITIISQEAYSLIGPIRLLQNGNVLLVPCEEIKLVIEYIDLYHHPLGIWMVEYRALLQNMRSRAITQPVGFPAIFDIRMIEGELYCDRFENFKVFIDTKEPGLVQLMTRCSNYMETTGTKWSVDDGSAISYLNTWDLNFKPDEKKWITVNFTFITKKAPSIYNPENKESWYLDLVNWVREDYSRREENDFQLPLNIGSFWAFYPDSIIIRAYLANDWLKVVDKSARHYDPLYIKRYEFSEPVGFYSPPEVRLDTLTVAQLETNTRTGLILLRNCFFAKYGRKFQSPTLKKYFNAQPWYSENPQYHHWYLTKWDLDNIKLISEIEKNMK